MKKYYLIFSILLATAIVSAQTKPKPKGKPAQSQMDKAMEDAMKGMSAEEKAEMKKMMKEVMPALTEVNAKRFEYPGFTSNMLLIPKKDVARINAIPKKSLVNADINSYAGNLFTKFMAKGNAEEIIIVKKIIAKTSKAGDIGNAAFLALLQGHPQAAMALSIKAVRADPANLNWQNNMAALLTQNGYPEQAIPVLQKLKKETSNNSTVLNNLAIAWLGLGEIDSAKLFTALAIKANPQHPEANLCGGLLEELNGDPVKATDQYINAMENAVNPFTEQVIKNNNGQGKLDDLDFEKIKRSITIYEYFPKDWIKIPRLSDNVSGYESDMSIKNGYEKMIEGLKDKIESLKDASETEINALVEKGEGAFAKEMMKETMKGLNMMSTTAVIVQRILQASLLKMQQENTKKFTVLIENINAKRAQMTKTNNNDKCADFDRKNNQFLAYANPLIRDFHAKRIEEFRMWLNAFCTWIWYISGNPKNAVLTMCIAWTEAITEMYSDAVYYQEAIAKSCVQNKGDGIANIPAPEIPNFTCPTMVKIPVGPDWQNLEAASSDFNNNIYDITKSGNTPILNASVAFGVGNMIAQPGKAPFIKTANGSISPGMINSVDDDLTPLSKIPPDELTPLPDLNKSKLAKELLKKLVTSDCKNVKKYKYKPLVFEVGIGELIMEEAKKNVKSIEEKDGATHITYDDGSEAVFMEDGSILEIEAPKKAITEVKENGDITYITYDDGSEVVFMEDGSILEVEAAKDPGNIGQNKTSIKPKPVTPDVISKNKVYTELKNAKTQFDANGLQPSISSGLQAPGTVTPIKGLFQ